MKSKSQAKSETINMSSTKQDNKSKCKDKIKKLLPKRYSNRHSKKLLNQHLPKIHSLQSKNCSWYNPKSSEKLSNNLSNLPNHFCLLRS